MHTLIQDHLGRIYHSLGYPSYQVIRPLYCFVPEEFFGPAGYDRYAYLDSPWPSINCSANPFAIGSHVLPNPRRPTNIHSRCPILERFLKNLPRYVSKAGRPSTQNRWIK